MIDVMEQSKIPTRELYSGEKFPVWDWEPSVQTNTVQMRSQKQYMVR